MKLWGNALGSRWVAASGWFLFAFVGHAQDIQSRTSGTPQFLGRELGPESYVPVVTRQPKNAKVLWVNRALLREKWGLEVPDGPLPEKLKKEILDALAWRIPNPGEPDEHFVPGKQKTFYADRYGGWGQGTSGGSGRAASAGEVQIKGIGRTPLVAAAETYDHAHGGASIEEAIREAIWGEVNHHELPGGSNRVVAILDSQDETNWKLNAQGKLGGRGALSIREKRGLIVRLDALRPATFVSNPFLLDEDAVKEVIGGQEVHDQQRTAEALTRLGGALPQNEATRKSLAAGAKLDDEQLVRSGMEELARRLGDQWGAAYARGLFHGAASTSNVELDGKFLDFGTQTAQPGFGPIRFLSFAPSAGEEELQGLRDEVLDRLGDAAKTRYKWVPSTPELDQILRQAFERRLDSEIPGLTGVPTPVVEGLRAKQISGDALRRSFLEMATIGSSPSKPPIMVNIYMPDRTATYDMRKVLIALARHPEASADEVENQVRRELARQSGGKLPRDQELHRTLRRFAVDYATYLSAAAKEAERRGVKAEAFRTYVRERAKVMNRPLRDLYRAEMVPQNVALIGEYSLSKDPSLLAKSIDRRIAVGVRDPKGLTPYQVQVGLDDGIDGALVRTVFDAQANRYQVSAETHAGYGRLQIGGREFAEADWAELKLQYKGEHGSGTVSAQRGPDGLVHFEAPVEGDRPGKLSVSFVHAPPKGQPWSSKAVNVDLQGATDQAINATVSPSQALVRSQWVRNGVRDATALAAKIKAGHDLLKQEITPILESCEKSFRKLLMKR